MHNMYTVNGCTMQTAVKPGQHTGIYTPKTTWNIEPLPIIRIPLTI